MPVLESLNISNTENLFFTENGAVGRCFEIDLIDYEQSYWKNFEQNLIQFSHKMEAGFLYRIYLHAEKVEDTNGISSRTQDLGMIGSTKFRAFIVVMALPSLLDKVRLIYRSLVKSEFSLVQQLDARVESLGLQAAPFNAPPVALNEVKQTACHEYEGQREVIYPTYLEDNHGCKTMLSLEEPGYNDLSFFEIADVFAQLEPPYTICHAIKPHSREISEALVRSKAAKITGGFMENFKAIDAVQDLNSKVSVDGLRLYDFDYSMVLFRESPAALKTAVRSAKDSLSLFGDFVPSIYCLTQHYQSVLPDEDIADTNLEAEDCIPMYMPLVLNGTGCFKEKSDSLVVHRRNEALDGFNLFDERYQNYSACIFGRSGSGKSVLTNLLTKSLLNGPQNKIIKIDVGGSHSSETKALGGVEYRLSMDQPSGINPFKLASELSNVEASASVLSSFLSVLILENGESELKKQMKGDLEESLSHYLESTPKSPSLSGFLLKSNSVPRIEILKRWGDKGIYKNAFKEIKDQRQNPNLSYYNFAEIFQASDPDYGQGGLAAVMALFNFEMMKQDQKHLIFMADETPFFIKKCFPFFKFSTANVRKFGGSFVTIAQNSHDVVVNGDTGIISNSNSKFLFSKDGSDDEFCERLALTDRELISIEGLKREVGKYSEVFLDDGVSRKVLRLRISPQEYWSMTSSHSDKSKISSLLKSVPGLTQEEAIRCLSLS